MRLGIPLAVWLLFIDPLPIFIVKMDMGTHPMDLVTLLDPVNGPALGPMCFVFFLLVATFVYLL